MTKPGRTTVNPNPLGFKIEFDPDKLAAGRGGPHAFFKARSAGASQRINAAGIEVCGLTNEPKVIGRKSEDKFGLT